LLEQKAAQFLRLKLQGAASIARLAAFNEKDMASVVHVPNSTSEYLASVI
jgi:hypothetical protein